MRKDFNRDISELQKEILTRDYKDDYSYDYQGIVVDNNDPEKIGRCKVRVYNLFTDSIPDSDLPWSLPENTLFDGSFVVPPIGAIVNVRFDRGDIYCPIYTTKVVDRNNLPSQRLTNYPDTMVFFQTSKGDYFTVDRSDGSVVVNSKKITFNVGTAKVIIDGNAGTVQIDGKMNMVTPTGSGGFCALPFCLFTGTSHTGDMVS